MNLNDFDFYLPESLIAQNPLPNRTGSRLLVLDKKTGAVQHKQFTDLKNFLKAGDTLVLNNTRVIPARLFGIKEGTGAHIEVLLLKPVGEDRWETLVKPGKRVHPGNRIQFGDGLLTAECLEETEIGGRLMKFEYEGIFNELLERLGEMPLPPYIKAQLEDKERYQTVYAKHSGSAAAPTAGLHFTEEYLEELKQMGVNLAFVTLHVGLGTFRPVSVEDVEKHTMHSEFYRLDEENARMINETKARGNRVIAVGTTSCRTIETIGHKHGGVLKPEEGWTSIFIYPGYQFSVIDGLLTNFHLPKSTLVMLVSALAGREAILHAYKEAVDEKYRFFSFGDAMLIISEQ
ncbi:tRNA preQ1(34) S-adenosylmethionine ribosyltransferase-isomerase QueA [Aneurinibacillus sp. Ricciae_BoGa-3]|uniref:tRNA preQ1(34) S-adenosylmethionine ribosyltransferase-isomerase QueA n=1 Tax=Aneurinibacillus sp. Ricciae_BoGa-3 TaxID=3022697 RepID=UPI00233FB0D5|nr:tRNA preQ1(34) S-adenosylmethionine ribosyltransferase-isomerase QueA [Aneurinibacillus sp. Ricciae_BoGa-3]WCK53617.1 tRNA preQ1(34) S-adenosylmethionine ribosyltransferase-isomerase QueA [Aneurinibacillus sp. Ricciae_BoGa-3]